MNASQTATAEERWLGLRRIKGTKGPKNQPGGWARFEDPTISQTVRLQCFCCTKRAFWQALVVSTFVMSRLWGDPGARNNNIHKKSQQITTNHTKSHKINTKNHKKKKNLFTTNHKKSQAITKKKSYSQTITKNHKQKILFTKNHK